MVMSCSAKNHASSEQTACLTYLRQIYREITFEYLVENQDVFPPTGYQVSPSTCPAAVPSSRSRYIFNSDLAGTAASSITEPSNVPLVYESGYNHGRKRRVLMVNGEVRDLTPQEWAQVRTVRPSAGVRP